MSSRVCGSEQKVANSLQISKNKDYRKQPRHSPLLFVFLIPGGLDRGERLRTGDIGTIVECGKRNDQPANYVERQIQRILLRVLFAEVTGNLRYVLPGAFHRTARIYRAYFL